MGLSTFLAGKKTYITAAAGVLGTVAAAANGEVSLPTAGVSILGALLATFVRAGSKADAAKSTAETTAAVVATLAPIVAAASPGAAKVAGTVGTIASDIGQALAPQAATA